MIEPEVSGPTLAAEIRAGGSGPLATSLWRLGQSGVVLRFPGATVVIDAYLSNHCEAVLGDPFDHRRLTRSPLDPVDLDTLTLVICSHDHLDHLDPPTVRTLARNNPVASVAAPRAAASTLRELGWADERVLTFDDGVVVETGGLRVSAFAVPHDEFDEGIDGHPYLGWVVSDGHTSVAHLGDARSHPRVVAALRAASVDVLLVPINGRSRERAAMGFAGNLDAVEAVQLGLNAGAALTVPMHYDMFAQNIDPGALDTFESAAAAAGLVSVVLPVGRRLEIARGR